METFYCSGGTLGHLDRGSKRILEYTSQLPQPNLPKVTDLVHTGHFMAFCILHINLIYFKKPLMASSDEKPPINAWSKAAFVKQPLGHR